jgi:hypothetical protein
MLPACVVQWHNRSDVRFNRVEYGSVFALPVATLICTTGLVFWKCLPCVMFYCDTILFFKKKGTYNILFVQKYLSLCTSQVFKNMFVILTLQYTFLYYKYIPISNYIFHFFCTYIFTSSYN